MQCRRPRGSFWPPLCGHSFSCGYGTGGSTRLYAYADESGTFDKVHNDLFVYAGVIILGKDAKDDLERRYTAV